MKTKFNKKTIKELDMSSLLGITSVLDFIDETGNVTDRRGLIQYLDNGVMDEYDMKKLVRKSPEARKIVRDWSERSYRQAIKKKPDSFFIRMRKDAVEKDIKAGKDPFDSWYEYATNQNLQAKNTFLNSILSIFRIFSDGSY